MDLQVDKLLDRIGRKILAALQANARTPIRRIGEMVGLSAPAVAERVKKLESSKGTMPASIRLPSACRYPLLST
jgi:Lrp/AsnC family leucine-responsive transcriptional regulator